MRRFALALTASCFVGVCSAETSPRYHTGVTADRVSGTGTYCQDPSDGAINASTGYESELADDIPHALAGSTISHVTFHHVQWEATVTGYVEPTSLIVNFYVESCPPDMEPDLSFTIAWDELDTEMTFESDDTYRARITATLPMDVTIVAGMSIGVLVDNDWGEGWPFNGFATTHRDEVGATCEGHFDGDHWGNPRWTRISELIGVESGVAYCLQTLDPTPTQLTSWSAVKATYR